MADPLNRVPFPLAGEGACLRYRTADYVELRKKYGEPKIVERRNPDTGFPEEIWETFTSRIEQAVMLHQPDVILDCLKLGLKSEDGRTPRSDVDYSDLPFSWVACVQPIRDALVLALTNEPFAKLLAARREREELNARLRNRGVEFNDAEEDGPDPSMAPMTSASSGESSGSDTPLD